MYQVTFQQRQKIQAYYTVITEQEKNTWTEKVNKVNQPTAD